MIEQDDMIQDIEAEVHHEITIITKRIIYRSTSRDRFSYDKNTTPPQSYDHEMTTINAIQDLTDHLTGHHIDLPIDVILVPDRDHVHIHETKTFNYILYLSDHLQD